MEGLSENGVGEQGLGCRQAVPTGTVPIARGQPVTGTARPGSEGCVCRSVSPNPNTVAELCGDGAVISGVSPSFRSCFPAVGIAPTHGEDRGRNIGTEALEAIRKITEAGEKTFDEMSQELVALGQQGILGLEQRPQGIGRFNGILLRTRGLQAVQDTDPHSVWVSPNTFPDEVCCRIDGPEGKRATFSRQSNAEFGLDRVVGHDNTNMAQWPKVPAAEAVAAWHT